MSFDNAVSAASPAAGGGVPAASPFAVAADVEQQAASRQPSTMWEDVERQVVCNIEFQGDSTTKVGEVASRVAGRRWSSARARGAAFDFHCCSCCGYCRALLLLSRPAGSSLPSPPHTTATQMQPPSA